MPSPSGLSTRVIRWTTSVRGIGDSRRALAEPPCAGAWKSANGRWTSSLSREHPLAQQIQLDIRDVDSIERLRKIPHLLCQSARRHVGPGQTTPLPAAKMQCTDSLTMTRLDILNFAPSLQPDIKTRVTTVDTRFRLLLQPTFVAFAILAYIFSLGPACWISSRTASGTSAVAIFYRPLWVCAKSLPMPCRQGVIFLLNEYSEYCAAPYWNWTNDDKWMPFSRFIGGSHRIGRAPMALTNET